MQKKEAEELRKSMEGKACDHPKFSKEYDLAGDTGDFICTTCGRDFTKSEKETIETNRK